jgi:hypothetical protein
MSGANLGPPIPFLSPPVPAKKNVLFFSNSVCHSDFENVFAQRRDAYEINMTTQFADENREQSIPIPLRPMVLPWHVQLVPNISEEIEIR